MRIALDGVVPTSWVAAAKAAFSSGKYVQGFPEHGPERMGAPITAYNRISARKSVVIYPDFAHEYYPESDDLCMQFMLEMK